MSLTRRMAVFIATVLALALGGAWLIHTLGMRQTLQQQQDMRNRDSAAALALALSQQKGDAAAMQAVAAAQFDQGHYRRITLTAPDGRQLIDLQQPATAAQAPAWFAALMPLQAEPGRALVSHGWAELGQLSVQAHTAWAQDALWNASARSAGLLAVLATAAAALAGWLLRAWQRPLAATVAQAQALENGRFVQAELPALPELQQLTRAMNATVARLREVFASQAQQVAHLQRRAQLDALTGLPLRAQFVRALDRQLAGGLAQPGLSLLLVRVCHLDQINQQRGRDTADRVLAQVAAVLRRLQQAEPDSLAGRLSGTDFALCLPVPGTAAEHATALHRALREAAVQAAPGLPVPARVLVAAAEGVNGAQAEALLASTSWALVRAEAGNGLHIEPLGPHAERHADLADWRRRLSDALDSGHMWIAEFPVLDAQGGLIHLECPLRLQLEPQGELRPASQWLAMARRCGLLPQVDQAVIRLALQAIARDGRARAVNVALSSLSAPGMVAAVAAQLRGQPQAAAGLSIEWTDGGTPEDWAAAEPALALWRSLGVRMGVEHAGAAPEQLTRLRDLGLSYVKVDGLHLRGAAHDAAVNAYARSLVGLIQLLGLKAMAEGVDNTDDLAALWALGFDGATGSALREEADGSGWRQLVAEPASVLRSAASPA